MELLSVLNYMNIATTIYDAAYGMFKDIPMTPKLAHVKRIGDGISELKSLTTKIELEMATVKEMYRELFTENGIY